MGDTETPPDADWSLPAQEKMILGLLDALGLDEVAVVGHDHGGAVAQLLAARHPERIGALVLCNVEAYDNWPSADERPLVRLTQVPVVGALLLKAYGTPRIHRLLLSIGKAVKNKDVLDDEVIAGYVRANASDLNRLHKTARFLAGQLDPDKNRWTNEALPGLRLFGHPTLLPWGEDDVHFGPNWARKLEEDIPGVEHVEILPDTGHLLMEERPVEVSSAIRSFLSART